MNFSFVYNFIVLHFTVGVLLSCVRFFVIPQTVTHKAPLSIGLSKQGSWSGLPFPPPEDLPNPKIEPLSPVAPVLASRLFITELPRKPIHTHTHTHTHTGNIALNLISILRSHNEIFNLQSISYFFFPVLSLIQYSLFAKFFIWSSIYPPFLCFVSSTPAGKHT